MRQVRGVDPDALDDGCDRCDEVATTARREAIEECAGVLDKATARERVIRTRGTCAAEAALDEAAARIRALAQPAGGEGVGDGE
jgi:hypothetical protein